MKELEEFVDSLTKTSVLCRELNLDVDIIIYKNAYEVEVKNGVGFTIKIRKDDSSYAKDFYSYKDFKCSGIDMVPMCRMWAKYSGKILHEIYEAGMIEAETMANKAASFQGRLKTFKKDFGHLMVAATLKPDLEDYERRNSSLYDMSILYPR